MAQHLLTSLDVFVRLRAACKAAGGQAAWARRHEVTPTYVSDVLNDRTPPGEKILAALGLKKVPRYVETRRVNG